MSSSLQHLCTPHASRNAVSCSVCDAAKSCDNLLERFVAAAHAECTLGEIAGVLREVFGEYKEPKFL
jgi:methylmalonyl-CoA mutase N-terminal domain/subunit